MEIIKANMTKSNQVIQQVSVNNLDKIISDKRYTIIDVRLPNGVASQGSIPGAINIPFDEALYQIDNREETPDSILNRDGPFLFCCTGGVMSYMAAIHAQETGIKRVFNLEGGHAAWKKLKRID